MPEIFNIKRFFRKKRLQAGIISKTLSLRYFYKLILILVVVELLIMFMLHYIDLDTSLLEPLLDASLLALICFPLLMHYIIEPFSQEMNSQVSKALDERTQELKELNHSLEDVVAKKTAEITQKNEELRAIWNVEKNIMIFTDGVKLKDVNLSFFDFFQEYKTLESFTKEHSCICDFFEKRDNPDYIYQDSDDTLWLDPILLSPDKLFKVAMKRKDSTYIFSVHAQKIFSGESTKFVVTFNDITTLENYQNHLEEEVKKTTDALQKKDKIMLAQSRQAAMGDMISMIAHQWRQPITTIGMSAQNMQLDIELEDIDIQRFDTKLTKIVEQTHFLSKTIDDFRDFLKPVKKPCSCILSNIAEDTLSIIGKSLENNNIMLEKSYKGDIKVTTYANEVIQVLMNIINNAKDIIIIKELKNGLITIQTYSDKESAYIKICDNAGGIPKEVLPKIFEPYFTTKEEKGGTGLGLYMSQMIVEKHLKGTIDVQNSVDGACFTVSLPLKKEFLNSQDSNL